MKALGISTAIAVILLPLVASAQERPQRPKPADQGWTVSAGGGVLVSPNYLGDDSYGISTVPYIRVTYADKFEATVQDGARYNLVNNENFRAGPLATLDFGRNEDGSGAFRVIGDDTNDLLGLGDIDTSVSLGGFAEFDFGDLTASANLTQALGGHDGLTGEIGLRYGNVLRGYGPPLIYSFGPNIRFGDDQYTNAYFGVTADQALASGLAQSTASGGITSYGVSGVAILPIADAVSLTLFGNYNRLTADAAASPLVTQRGSKDQAFLGLAASYTFK